MSDKHMISEELLDKISGSEVSGARDFVITLLTFYKELYSGKEEFTADVPETLEKKNTLSEEDKDYVRSIIDKEWPVH